MVTPGQLGRRTITTMRWYASRISTISLPFFTPSTLADEHFALISGEFPGHQRGGKRPPMGSIYWPRTRVADDAISSTDGYAARDVLGFLEPIDGITDDHRTRLSHRAAEAGLGIRVLPEPLQQRLIGASDKAAAVLDLALRSRTRWGMATLSG